MRSFLLIVLVAMISAIALFTQREPAQIGPQFVVIHDINQKLSSAEKKDLEVMISRQVEFHQRHLTLPDNIVVPTRIFGTKKKYRDFQKRVSKNSDSKNGFYSGSRKEIIINQNKRFMNTIAHEAQHYIIRLDARRPFKWINQGLSEFYEETFLKRKKVYVAVQDRKLERLEKWLNAESLIPLHRYLKVSNDDWDDINKKLPRANSTMAWGLVYFFMSTEERKKILSDIIRELKDGSKANSYNTVNSLYPGGVDQLEEDFRSFIKRMPETLKI